MGWDIGVVILGDIFKKFPNTKDTYLYCTELSWPETKIRQIFNLDKIKDMEFKNQHLLILIF